MVCEQLGWCEQNKPLSFPVWTESEKKSKRKHRTTRRQAMNNEIRHESMSFFMTYTYLKDNTQDYDFAADFLDFVRSGLFNPSICAFNRFAYAWQQQTHKSSKHMVAELTALFHRILFIHKMSFQYPTTGRDELKRLHTKFLRHVKTHHKQLTSISSDFDKQENYPFLFTTKCVKPQ